MTNIAAAITEVKALLGQRLNTSKSVCELHGQNETYFPKMLPNAVAFPHNTLEVSKVVKICEKYYCPIIPWGVGTSLEGHALALHGGITLNMSEMNNTLEVNTQDMLAVVQPGITREILNKELRSTGLFFSVDPGANATLGGMAATRASGTTSVLYGTMRENVLAMEIVLADGKIIRTGTRAKKSSAGYDLNKLFVGSEGTLGIITELTVALKGQPEAISAAVCDFESIDDAVNVVIMAIQLGIPMARIELIDEISIRAINQYSKLEYPEKPHLFMEFHGSITSVSGQAETILSIAKDLRIDDAVDWIGQLTETETFYQGLDVFILSSNYEGFGLVLLEAMLQGVPIVARRVSAIPEVLGMKHTGLLDTDTPEEMAGRVEELITHPNLLSEVLIHQRKQLAEFSIENTCRLHSVIYAQMTNSSRD